MKLKLKPHLWWNEDLDDEAPVPNVYHSVEAEDGEVLMEYHECGTHAFYISPKVIALLERSEL